MSMPLREVAGDFATEAIGRSHRDDAVLQATGGPAGNARLTAWTGLLLLTLFLAELVTLLNVRGLLTWHVVIGIVLIPPALLKTASTGWRIVRYYAGNKPYRIAGPPSLILRMVGPLVVASTLAVLGSGLSLILITPSTARAGLFSAAGFAVSPLFLHKVAFVAWAVVTGIHTLGRLIPALRLTVLTATPRPIPGWLGRGTALVATLAVAAVVAAVTVSLAAPWRAERISGPHGNHHHRITQPAASPR